MYKIVIPYRDREDHLKIFAEKAIPFFEENNREYNIIIVEQVEGKPFNLGKLTNVGFDIFKNNEDYKPEDSFIFQPVDCIPYDAHYDAPRGGIAKLASHYSTPRDSADLVPAHILHQQNEWSPRNSQTPQGEPREHGVPYFYKAFTMDPVAYERVNGFSNDCWGWGGEDNEFFVRLGICKIKTVHRLCLYDMLDHELALLDYHHKNMNKVDELRMSRDIYRSGLSTLQYSIVEKTERCGFETYVCEV